MFRGLKVQTDYESGQPASTECDGMIFQPPGPCPSTTDTPGNEKHFCWLSGWLSTLSQQFYLFRRLWVEASDEDDRLPPRRLTGSSTWSSTPVNRSTIRTPS